MRRGRRSSVRCPVRQLGAFDAVAALGLGAVERAVGVFEQNVERFFGVEAARHADADRGIDLPVADFPAAFRERDPDAVGANAGRLDARSRQHDCEFLAAHAAEYVARPQCRRAGAGELAEYGVADRMAVPVVDGFEAIEVEHHHRDRRLVMAAALHEPNGAVQKSGAIGDAGQRVDARGFHADRLVAFLDQSKNENGGAEREYDALEINESEQTGERRQGGPSGCAAERAVNADQQRHFVHARQYDERPARHQLLAAAGPQGHGGCQRKSRADGERQGAGIIANDRGVAAKRDQRGRQQCDRQRRRFGVEIARGLPYQARLARQQRAAQHDAGRLAPRHPEHERQKAGRGEKVGSPPHPQHRLGAVLQPRKNQHRPGAAKREALHDHERRQIEGHKRHLRMVRFR